VSIAVEIGLLYIIVVQMVGALDAVLYLRKEHGSDRLRHVLREAWTREHTFFIAKEIAVLAGTMVATALSCVALVVVDNVGLAEAAQTHPFCTLAACSLLSGLCVYTTSKFFELRRGVRQLSRWIAPAYWASWVPFVGKKLIQWGFRRSFVPAVAQATWSAVVRLAVIVLVLYIDVQEGGWRVTW
jgi:hypothetical protein